MFYPYGTLRCEQKQTVYVSVCSKFSDCNLEKINEKKCPQSIIIVHGILDHRLYRNDYWLLFYVKHEDLGLNIHDENVSCYEKKD